MQSPSADVCFEMSHLKQGECKVKPIKTNYNRAIGIKESKSAVTLVSGSPLQNLLLAATNEFHFPNVLWGRFHFELSH